MRGGATLRGGPPSPGSATFLTSTACWLPAQNQMEPPRCLRAKGRSVHRQARMCSLSRNEKHPQSFPNSCREDRVSALKGNSSPPALRSCGEHTMENPPRSRGPEKVSIWRLNLADRRPGSELYEEFQLHCTG